jgi:hypothetical protein
MSSFVIRRRPCHAPCADRAAPGSDFARHRLSRAFPGIHRLFRKAKAHKSPSLPGYRARETCFSGHPLRRAELRPLAPIARWRGSIGINNVKER